MSGHKTGTPIGATLGRKKGTLTRLSLIITKPFGSIPRNLTGSNGYAKEIGFNPVEFIRERVSPDHKAAWLDLCCGTGKALIQAAQIILDDGLAEKIEIVGVDLVGMFHSPGHDSYYEMVKGS